MTTSESKGRFFFTKRIDSHNESNRFESRIGMLYQTPVILAGCVYRPDRNVRPNCNFILNIITQLTITIALIQTPLSC